LLACFFPDQQGHITNHHQNQDAQVWTLPQLMSLLTQLQSAQLWQDLSTIAGRVAAAAAQPVAEATVQLQLPANSAFELLGKECGQHATAVPATTAVLAIAKTIQQG
jgi:hypothetical protein